MCKQQINNNKEGFEKNKNLGASDKTDYVSLVLPWDPG